MSHKGDIIVTGGSGFIGSHLCEKLLDDGYKVTNIDTLITGSKENTKHLESNKNYTFINDQITKKLLTGLNIKTLIGVLHLASPASPVGYETYPIQTLHANSICTLEILHYLLDRKLKNDKDNSRFLLTSTSEIYGNPLQHPQDETYFGNINPIGPRSQYSEAKRFAEAATVTFLRTVGLNTAIARLFNTYGPRMKANDGRVLPNFINQILEDKPLTIHGDGLQTRSFCYVDDTVKGIYKLFFSNIHEPINIGNPNEVLSIREIATRIISLMGKGEINHIKEKPEDPTRRCPKIARAIKLLDWKPEITMAEGLFNTIQYFTNKKIYSII